MVQRSTAMVRWLEFCSLNYFEVGRFIYVWIGLVWFLLLLEQRLVLILYPIDIIFQLE